MKSKLNILLFLGFLCISSACSRLTDEEQQAWGRGKEVYLANCLSCHGSDGKGLEGAYPSLTRAEITPDFAVRIRYLIKNGSQSSGGMLPIHISKQETIEVINYVQNAWGNEADFETTQQSTQLSTK